METRMENGRWRLEWRVKMGGLRCLEWLFVGDVWMGGWSGGRKEDVCVGGWMLC